MSIGPMEIVIVLVLALLVFGPKRLPQAGRSLGHALREFRKVASAAHEELRLTEVVDGVNDLKSSLSIDLAGADAKEPPQRPAGSASADGASAGPPSLAPTSDVTNTAGSPPPGTR